jgi:hypothetical protein
VTYADYLEKCDAWLKAETKVKAAITSVSATWPANSFPDLYLRLDKAKTDYNQEVVAAQAYQDTLQKASDDLKKATTTPKTPTAAQDAAQAASNLTGALNALEAAGQATGIGQSEAAKARLQAIDAFITAASASDSTATKSASSSVALTPDLAQAASVLKTIPSVADQVSATASALNAPHLSTLEIEKAHQTALVDQAARTTSRAKQRIAMLEAAVEGELTEVQFLTYARLERTEAKKPPSPAPAPAKGKAKTASSPAAKAAPSSASTDPSEAHTRLQLSCSRSAHQYVDRSSSERRSGRGRGHISEVLGRHPVAIGGVIEPFGP